MTPPAIRPIAICVIRRGEELLVFGAHDAAEGLTLPSPLGGGLLFGEGSEEAVRRELREEIGAELENVALLGVLENTFEREAFDVVEETERLMGVWRHVASFDMSRVPLYPNGLLGLLARST